MSEPRVLGPYRLERLLGQGGMGAVWAARHVRTGRQYAVKVLLPEQSSERGAIARFRREAEALAAVGHAHIVPIHDYDVGPNGEWFLAMDLLEGEDLAHRLARGPLPWREAVEMLDPILSAIEAAHAAGLVHRDLKPSNVFLARQAGTGEEKPMLLDFGLARGDGASEVARAKVTATGTVLGTPAYMSPEQAQGASIDGRSDLWALAVILQEMITGRAPFDGPTLTAILLAVVTAPRPRLGDSGHTVPEALEAALDRAMAKDASARFADVRAFREALAHIAGTMLGSPRLTPTVPLAPASFDVSLAPTVSAAASGEPPESATRTASRVPTPAIALAAGALMALVVIGGLGVAWVALRDAPVPPPAAAAPPPVASTPLAETANAAQPAPNHPAPAPSSPDGPTVVEAAVPAAPTSPDEVHASAARTVRRPARAHEAAAEVTSASGSEPEVDGPAEPAAPAGPPAALVTATERMGVGDFDGCMRALEHAGTSAAILGARMNCALRTGRRRDLEETCALLHRHQPASAYTSTCDTLLRTAD